jgi:hypothetical protein
MKQPKETLSPQDRELLQFGLAAQIPGMQKAINHLQTTLDAMKAELNTLQGHPVDKPRVKRKYVKTSKNNKNGWGSMTKQERSIEMRRRMSLRNQPQERPKLNKNGKAEKMHPRDPRHPDHAKWLKRLRVVQKKKWAGMSFKERKERLLRMNEAKKRKKLAVMKLEAAS